MEAADTLRIDIFERGVGRTTASGTAALAAASVADKLGLTKSKELCVCMPGGQVLVELSADRVRLSGPISAVYWARLAPDLLRELETIE